MMLHGRSSSASPAAAAAAARATSPLLLLLLPLLLAVPASARPARIGAAAYHRVTALRVGCHHHHQHQQQHQQQPQQPQHHRQQQPALPPLLLRRRLRGRREAMGVTLGGMLGGAAVAQVAQVLRPAGAAAFELPGANKTCAYREAPEGLSVCDLIVGGGAEPLDDDIVKCNYEIKLADSGKLVVNARNYLFQLGIGEVVKGWETMIVGDAQLEPMRVGGVRRAVVPAELAYGKLKRGCAGDTCAIPPNSRLELTVELTGIKGITQLSGGASAVPFELS
eukprot:CAMPEP_0170182390 /NCGR_PEP_ID=MMETSP0040_2-20121228/27738_1 /TAXON_ID=641309 /ORGANISM="Lotharella oceanica, Strain CCMP622" /LENGTH=278 /DNA_ID=CAMNT_0010427779 /DNA_START=46 /DNA_END=882 /DNA_ORIENTATION=-